MDKRCIPLLVFFFTIFITPAYSIERIISVPFKFKIDNFGKNVTFNGSQNPAKSLILRIIDESNLDCNYNGVAISLLIGIISDAKNFKERIAIRRTWGKNMLHYKAKLVFIVGWVKSRTIKNALQGEQKKFKDLLRLNIIDTFTSITLKTISLLLWTDKYCSQAKFILKVDDDVFVNMKNLGHYIKRRNPTEQKLYGRLMINRFPSRENNTKRFLSFYKYQGDVPNYLDGSAYLIPKVVAKSMGKVALDYLSYHLEDIYMTGIVTRSLKIKLENYKNFVEDYKNLTSMKVDSNDIKNTFIAIHGVRAKTNKILDNLMKGT